ncbi:MAG: SET domain-containing protein [Cyclobacteriaceae bacterium]|nr:SET domain-containing protein-lysine N-methyltransferase [Cytophagales bacterium]HNP77711.1 SET domain-containing protein [Cyclobacteriaceae bacterium]
MALLEKQLYIKKSTLPGAGKGLFTKKHISKGTRIVEYKGQVMTWKEVQKLPDERNGYVFYFTLKYVIDAWKHKGFAHFANDAKGIVRKEGVRNNSEYVTEGRRCYIEAIRDIEPFEEIFVGYGGEYWQAIRYNIRFEQRKKEKAKELLQKKKNKKRL